MDERAALLRTIIENPGDDTPRLVYADWLEEHAGDTGCVACHGEGKSHDAYPGGWSKCETCNGSGRVSNGYRERAEFIRVQCELAKLPKEYAIHSCGRESPRFFEYERDNDCLTCWHMHLVTRQQELWPRMIGDGFSAAPNPPGIVRATCWPGELSTSSDEMGGIWHRGFIDTVECRLGDWLTHGRAICREHPVARVTITDRDPFRVDLGWRYIWEDYVQQGAGLSIHSLPHGIIEHIDGQTPGYFDDENTARLALSRACISFARS